jgi:hypothetical protein
MMEIQLQIDKANMNWNAYKNKKSICCCCSSMLIDEVCSMFIRVCCNNIVDCSRGTRFFCFFVLSGAAAFF